MVILGNHPYPRAVSKTSFPNSDPFAGTFVSIGATQQNTITFNVGAGGGGGTGAVVEATVGVGGTLAFTITNPGTGYVNPQINIPEPVYENLRGCRNIKIRCWSNDRYRCKFIIKCWCKCSDNKCWNWIYFIHN